MSEWTVDSSPLGLPPIEREVLGSCVQWADIRRTVRQAGISAGFFTRPGNQVIWSRICKLEDAGEPVDVLTLRASLLKTNEYERVGGDAFFGELTRGTVKPTPAAITALVGDLRTYHYAWQTFDRLHRDACELVKSPAVVTDGFFARHVAALEEIRTVITSADRPTVAGPDEQFAEYVEYLDRETDETIPFGLPSLQETTGGLRRANVGIVLARPGIGKTIIAANLAHHVSTQRQPVGHVFFSLEMPRPQIVGRLMRIASGLAKYEMRDALAAGRYTLDAYRVAVRHLLIVDRAGLSVAEMADHVREARGARLRDVGVGLVTVDHLHLVGGDGDASAYDRVSKHARELKDFAKRYDVAVLLLVQANRGGGGRGVSDGSEELTVSAARDSGAIEEVADWILTLRRKELTTDPKQADWRDLCRDQIQARLVKNRHGDLGREFTLRLDPRSLQVTEAL